jgi:hypothetical protein
MQLPASYIEDLLSKLLTIWRDLVFSENCINSTAIASLRDALAILNHLQNIIFSQGSSFAFSAQVQQYYCTMIDQMMSHFPYQSQEALVAAHGSRESSIALKLISDFNISICDLVLVSDSAVEVEEVDAVHTSSVSQYIIDLLAASIETITSRFDAEQSMESDEPIDGHAATNDDSTVSASDEGISSKLCRCLRVMIRNLFGRSSSCSLDSAAAVTAIQQLLHHLNQVLLALFLNFPSNSNVVIGHAIRSLMGAICSAITTVDHIPRYEGYDACEDLLQLFQTISSIFTRTEHHSSASASASMWQSARGLVYEELYLKAVVHIFQHLTLDQASSSTRQTIQSLVAKIAEAYESSSFAANAFLVADVLYYAIEAYDDDEVKLNQLILQILRATIKRPGSHSLHQYLLEIIYARSSRQLRSSSSSSYAMILLKDIDLVIQAEVAANADDAYSAIQHIDMVCSMMLRYLDGETHASIRDAVLVYVAEALSSLQKLDIDDGDSAAMRRCSLRCIACMKLIYPLLKLESDHEDLLLMACQLSVWLTIHLKHVSITRDQMVDEDRALLIKQAMVDLLCLPLYQASTSESIEAACSLYLRFLPMLEEKLLAALVDEDPKRVVLREAMPWTLLQLLDSELATMSHVPAVKQALDALHVMCSAALS